LTKEMRPKPAYRELKRLIRGAWWSRVDGMATADGRFKLRGHHGKYLVRVRDATGQTLVGEFTLARDTPAELVVKLHP
ncbi:MAG: hypothetical protein KDB23_30795, partial [Planctomycetales bacterium]|nr:hypothetical protein [Planctomycetales bacterium]